MRNRKIIYIVLAVLFVLCLILAGIIFSRNSQELKVVFLDVGQGDAILISEGSKQILIDGGASGQAVLDKLGRHVPFWDRSIEMIIATHPDQDHIGGLIKVMENYRIGAVLDTSAGSDSQTFKRYGEIIQEKNITRVQGERGMKIRLSEDKIFEILNPERGKNSKDSNAMSIVAKLSFGKNSFLFTGDIAAEEEAELIKNGSDLKTAILKVAHHGSKYSTSQEFLDAVNPKEAVISVGKNNRYGHPAPDVMERLDKFKIKIFRTDEKGDIRYECRNAAENCIIIAN